ncbi:hypothetical protein PCE1_001187 [Barthelona sp. PCE]
MRNVLFFLVILALTSCASAEQKDLDVEPEPQQYFFSAEDLKNRPGQALYAYHEGISKNIPAALYHYSKLKRYGSVELSLTQNLTEWLWALNKSASLGYPPAQTEYAVYLRNGYPVVPPQPNPNYLSWVYPEDRLPMDPQNPVHHGSLSRVIESPPPYHLNETHRDNSLFYLMMAAQQHEPRAGMILATKYMLGDGVPKVCTGAAKHLLEVLGTLLSPDLLNSKPWFKSYTEPISLLNMDDITRTTIKKNYVVQDTDKEIQFLEAAAKAGNTEARNRLAALKTTGQNGIPKNPDEARRFLEQGVAENDAEAIVKLGFWYYEESRNQKTEREKEEYLLNALQLFQKGISMNAADGFTGLGVMYYHGHGVEKNINQAADLFKEAAQLQSISGKFFLGIMYAKGESFEQDGNLAMKYLRDASESGHLLASVSLGQLFSTGMVEGVKVPFNTDCWTGVAFLRKAAAHIFVRKDLIEASNAYQEGNTDKSLTKLLFLSELGFETAAASSAFVINNEDDMIPERISAFDLMRKAAFLGHHQSFIDVARVLRDVKNHTDMVLWLEHSVKYQLAEIDFLLGEAYQFGYGVEVDFDMAKRYYDRTADHYLTDDNGIIDKEKKTKFIKFFAVLKLRIHGLYKHFTQGFPLGDWWRIKPDRNNIMTDEEDLSTNKSTNFILVASIVGFIGVIFALPRIRRNRNDQIAEEVVMDRMAQVHSTEAEITQLQTEDEVMDEGVVETVSE